MKKDVNKPIKLIYIHVLRYLVVYSKGLCKMFLPPLKLTGVSSWSVVKFADFVLSLKLRLKVALSARQDVELDR